MKSYISLALRLLVLAILLLFNFYMTSCNKKKESLLDKTVIQVNESKISLKLFVEALNIESSNHDSLQISNLVWWEQVKKITTLDLVHSLIFEQWARKNNLILTKDQITQSINELRSQYPNDYSFKKALSERGLNFVYWKDFQKKKLLKQLVIENIISNIDVTESDIEDYYKKNKTQFQKTESLKVEMITVSEEQQAEKLLSKMNRSKDVFQSLKTFSKDHFNLKYDTQNIIYKDSNPEFSALFNLKPGDISPIISTVYGYHIVLVKQKFKAENISLNQAKENIKNELIETKRNQFVDSWLKKQMSESKILINEELIRSIEVQKKGNL